LGHTLIDDLGHVPNVQSWTWMNVLRVSHYIRYDIKNEIIGKISQSPNFLTTLKSRLVISWLFLRSPIECMNGIIVSAPLPLFIIQISKQSII
jgi:hypothetical protein